jgi:cell pole-organizing protein PopZ
MSQRRGRRCGKLSSMTSVCAMLPQQEVVDIVGSQCLALLDGLPSGGGIMEGHSWLAEAGGDGDDGDDNEDSGPPPSLPSLAAARTPASGSAASATPALAAAAASRSSADAAALVAAVARGQDAREAAHGDAPAAGPHRRQQQEAAPATSSAAGTAAQGAAQPHLPQHQRQQQAGPALPPRPEVESVGTQAHMTTAEPAAADDGSDDADVLRRIENWAKVQVGLAVLSVPALLLGVWLSRQ